MRLLIAHPNQEVVQRLSKRLMERDIHHQVEAVLNEDWNSENYGTWCLYLWIEEEEELESARACWEEVCQRASEEKPSSSEEKVRITVEPQSSSRQIFPSFPRPSVSSLPPRKSSRRGNNQITWILMALCTLFLWLDRPDPQRLLELHSLNTLPNLPLAPLVTSPVKASLLYDYPKAYELVDELELRYGLVALTQPQLLPPEGKYLLYKTYHTPYWKGIDPLITPWLQGMPPPQESLGPLWEKISSGQWWRAFTPIFLHGDFMHLLFNMVWLLALGTQLEEKLGGGRYLLLILISAIVSNTAQYLMSGPNFVGFSGVLCAMLAFIGYRQYGAPRERYRLHPTTLRVMLFFTLGVASMELLFSLAQFLTSYPLATGVANTAHLSGLAIGYGLAHLPFLKATA